MSNIVVQKIPVYLPRNKDIQSVLQRYLPTDHVKKLKASLILLFLLISLLIGIIIYMLVRNINFLNILNR